MFAPELAVSAQFVAFFRVLALLCESEPGQVTATKANISDTHNGGKNVSRFEFASGCEEVIKRLGLLGPADLDRQLGIIRTSLEQYLDLKPV